MKKLVLLPPELVEYVQTIAKQVSDPRAIKGNFSKALKIIIEEYKKNHDNAI